MRAERFGAHVVVQYGSVVTHRRTHIEHRRENFVVDLNQAYGFFGNVNVVGRDGGDGVAPIQNFIFRQHVGLQVPHVDGSFAQLDDPIALLGQICVRHDRSHAG